MNGLYDLPNRFGIDKNNSCISEEELQRRKEYKKIRLILRSYLQKRHPVKKILKRLPKLVGEDKQLLSHIGLLKKICGGDKILLEQICKTSKERRISSIRGSIGYLDSSGGYADEYYDIKDSQETKKAAAWQRYIILLKKLVK